MCSIIIVTYNGLDVTRQTLESYQAALSLDEQNDYEMIVVDNDSQDGVADMVESRFPQVHRIRNSQNMGFSKANNIGFRASQGNYLLFSNPDVTISGETLPTIVARMEQDPSVGACTPYLKLVRTGTMDWGAHRGFPTPWAAFTYFTGLASLARHSRLLSRVFGQYHLLDRDLAHAHEVDVIRGGFFFVRRHVFMQAGGWDESYFMYGEDIDLCYQIKRLGHRIMFYPEATVFHHHGMTTGLKRHSQHASSVPPEAQRKAYDAFYDAMKVFYDKNYQTMYNPVFRWLLFLAIDAKRKLGMRKRVV